MSRVSNDRARVPLYMCTASIMDFNVINVSNLGLGLPAKISNDKRVLDVFKVVKVL